MTVEQPPQITERSTFQTQIRKHLKPDSWDQETWIVPRECRLLTDQLTYFVLANESNLVSKRWPMKSFCKIILKKCVCILQRRSKWEISKSSRTKATWTMWQEETLRRDRTRLGAQRSSKTNSSFLTTRNSWTTKWGRKVTRTITTRASLTTSRSSPVKCSNSTVKVWLDRCVLTYKTIWSQRVRVWLDHNLVAIKTRAVTEAVPRAWHQLILPLHRLLTVRLIFEAIA